MCFIHKEKDCPDLIVVWRDLNNGEAQQSWGETVTALVMCRTESLTCADTLHCCFHREMESASSDCEYGVRAGLNRCLNVTQCFPVTLTVWLVWCWAYFKQDDALITLSRRQKNYILGYEIYSTARMSVFCWFTRQASLWWKRKYFLHNLSSVSFWIELLSKNDFKFRAALALHYNALTCRAAGSS